MIKIVKKNKILFVIAIVVLLCGAFLAGLLLSNTDAAKAAQQIKTAEAEASEQAVLAAQTSEPSASAAPSETSGQLSAEGLRRIVMDKEYRRSYTIPVLDNTVIHEAETWSSIEPENFNKIKGDAFLKTIQLAKDFFGFEVKDAIINFWYYTDTSKLRDDFVKVATMDDSIVCTLKADSLDLINIDYNIIPAGTRSEDEQRYSFISDETSQTADKIAAVFDTTVTDIQASGGGGYQNEYEMRTFDVTLANRKFVKFALLNGEFYGVSVYPTKACMVECVYFEADVQRDPSIIRLVSPQDFKEGEPGEGDMTRDEAQDIYMSFLNLANGAGDYEAPAMTFFIDNSGARENYWHLESKKLKMDIASKSKWILSLTCDNLWNPEHDLTGMEYASMGGQEYADYVRNIMSGIYGNEALTEVSNNAVYDGNYCTEDAWMTDGTVYEFMFEDGKLTEVQYYYDSERFRNGPLGWKADSEYINTTTGEHFSPQ